MEIASTLLVRPGSPSPLGASWDGAGTNFAVYSEGASGIELCLFDKTGKEIRVPMRDKTEFVWHVYLEGIAPGQLYGYRVDGPWEPQSGLRFNPHNVLLDPYARAVASTEDWSKGAFSYDIHHPDRDLVRNESDSRGAPLGVVVDSTFDWGDDAPPKTSLRNSVIYEAHVKGFTYRHPDVPEELRGTYAALGSEPVLRYLRELGITAVELLPIHQFVDDQFLLEKGLRNYWGYNSIGFFAPDVRYRAGAECAAEVRQFKEAVKALHAAGIEVILDVVYNHTAEGNHLGPTLSLKGIDNRTYYRLVGDNPRFYFDYTGTGNSLNVRHPQALRLIMDSLRYWVEEMHVDGFRFDLASTLARNLHEVDKLSGFFTIINQDPVIGKVKLIAEPWDVGEGGYQVGNFPVGWAEWNGKYRDAIRPFWRGDGGRIGEIGYRLTGSADLYQPGGRSPSASINLVTAHDGFTLRDLVSYNDKHNEANKEGNRDGAHDNASWNCGVEGETHDAEVNDLRWRQMRNFLATLLLSQGTPMIVFGDEVGRTQQGNNNAYCQDSELSWFDWNFDERARALLAFTKRVIKLRKDHPLFRRARFLDGRDIRGLGVTDIAWFRHDGEAMSDSDWSNPSTSSVGIFFAGSGIGATDEKGDPIVDDDILLVMNASGADLPFVLPAFGARTTQGWELLIDTFDDETKESVEPGIATTLRARSLKVYARRAPAPSGLRSVFGAPPSTYRLQLNKQFTFCDALNTVDYLASLGVGGVYSSPYLQAETGSTHGYNVTNHAALNREIGTDDEHRAWTAAMRSRGLQHLVDFVPNHVGIGSGENAWWQDVLENGPSSEYADFFDIDWEPISGLRNKVLLPVLAGQFGEELEAGKLSFRREDGRFYIAYYERKFPASLRSYRIVLEAALLKLSLPVTDPAVQELGSIVSAIRHLPPPSSTTLPARSERAREKEVVKRRLAALYEGEPAIAKVIDEVLVGLNASASALEEVLLAQNYRLSYSRVAAEEINYRRFFDVNELASIRMEDPRVFEASHGLLFEMISEGRITGLRLDHTDGLYDPGAYFEKLQVGIRRSLAAGGHPVNVPAYVVAEKILEHGEEMPRTWAVSGTTGYDYLAAINGVWVDASAEESMTELYGRFTGVMADFRRLAYHAKQAIMDSALSSEIHMLGHALKRIAEQSRHARDFTLSSLLRVIKETIAAFSVYRTYVRPDGSYRVQDEAQISAAIKLAKRRNRLVEPSAFDFLAGILRLEDRSPAAVWFAMRFQQMTGPIMAKGVEDTAVYRFHRLTALNDVGCDVSQFGTSVGSLHAHSAAMLARWPLSMTTTTTHDTKRSEDVRARLAVLSEIPKEWEALVRDLHGLAEGNLRELDGESAPSRNDAYLFYQTVIGAFPFEGFADASARVTFVDRLESYMLKAAHEAKDQTAWIAPNEDYDRALREFVVATLKSDAFVAQAEEFVRRIAPYGACNSLAQLAIRLASPGVPDIYQGCELWDLSLVDPDNRRPVDFVRRRQLLEALDAQGEPTPELATGLVQSFVDGRIKLHVTRTGLRMRRDHHGLFLEGSYRVLDGGPHIIAFERAHEGHRLICVAPRLPRSLTHGEVPWALGKVWGAQHIELGEGEFVNAFTGEKLVGGNVALALVLCSFPVAWLVSGP